MTKKDSTPSLLLRFVVAQWIFMGLAGIPILVFLDPLGGWRWEPHNAVYDQMIVSIYVAAGITAIGAWKNPKRHLLFLWFMAISSFTHGFVMLYHALADSKHLGHLAGDVWILAGGLVTTIAILREQ